MTPRVRDGLSWQWLRFDQLSVPQLYALLRLRSEVFVVEQNCVFLDMDGLDAQAMHLLGVRVAVDSAQAKVEAAKRQGESGKAGRRRKSWRADRSRKSRTVTLPG